MGHVESNSKRGRYIAISGPIGVGKTLAAELVVAHTGATLVHEHFAENPFLSRLYEPGGIERWAMACEIAFLPPRLDQMHAIEDLLARGVDVVADWVWWQTPLFARLTMCDDEFSVYRNLADRLVRQLPTPDLVVCLTATLDTLAARVRRRARANEISLDMGYLARVREAYLSWQKEPPGRTRWLHVDTTTLALDSDEAARAALLSRVDGAIGVGAPISPRPRTGRTM